MQWERERQEKEERERQQKKRKLIEKSESGDGDIDAAALEELIEEGKRMASKSSRGEATGLPIPNPSDTPQKHHHRPSVSREPKSASGVSATPRQETALEAIMRKEKKERMLHEEGGDRERGHRDVDHQEQHLVPHQRNERTRSRSDQGSPALSLRVERSRHHEDRSTHRGRDEEESQFGSGRRQGSTFLATRITFAQFRSRGRGTHALTTKRIPAIFQARLQRHPKQVKQV